MIMMPISRVLLPVLHHVRADDGRDERQAYEQSFAIMFYVSLPVTVGLVVVAEALVETVFGAPLAR